MPAIRPYRSQPLQLLTADINPAGYKPTQNPYSKILWYHDFLLYLDVHMYEQKYEIVYVSEFSSMTLKNIFICLKCVRQQANFVAISI